MRSKFILFDYNPPVYRKKNAKKGFSDWELEIFMMLEWSFKTKKAKLKHSG